MLTFPRSAFRSSLALGCFAAGALAQEPWDAETEGAPKASGGNAGPLHVLPAQGGKSDDTNWDWSRPDARPPTGVTFTDVLDPKEWMVYLRYQRTEQDGLRNSRDDLSSQDAFDQGYTVAPTEMTTDAVDIQMFYGWDEHWTFFAELPWIAREMENDTENGDDFTTNANGIGDLKLGAVRTLHEDEGRKLIANLGLSVPTGSVDETDNDADGNSITLPYSMQIGTGTYDVHPGVSWLVQYDTWSWGAQGQWRLRIGENNEGWAKSNEGDISAWLGKSFSPSIAGSLRVRGYFWGDVHGESDDLDPATNPLNDRHRQGGERIDLVGGLTWQLGEGHEAVRTLGFEAGKPVAEWLDGPGLSTDFYLIFGWRYSF
jgi:hypothetical protein